MVCLQGGLVRQLYSKSIIMLHIIIVCGITAALKHIILQVIVCWFAF